MSAPDRRPDLPARSQSARGVVGLCLLLFSGACLDSGQDARNPPEPPGVPTVLSYGNLHLGARVVSVASSPFDAETANPLIGRRFVAREFEASAVDVVVLSHALWQQLGESREILGETVIVGGRTRVVVGIMPPDDSRGDWFVAWVPR